MQLTLLPSGRVMVQNEFGSTYEIGPGHPDFERIRAQCEPVKCNLLRIRLFGLLMIAIGLAGWWYNRHLAATEGEFYVKLCLLGPLGLFGGFLLLARPDWAGPLQPDSTRAHKFGLIAVTGLVIVASGIIY
jgi:hypothetical protein